MYSYAMRASGLWMLLVLALGSFGCSRSNDPAASENDAGSDEHDVDEEDGFSCEGSGISKAPWVLAIDKVSAKIRWEACREGLAPEIRLAKEGGGEATTIAATMKPFEVTETYKAALKPEGPHDWAGTYYMHEAELTGLSPSTCYEYELAAYASAKGRFCTAREAGESFKFFVIGDTNPGLSNAAANVLNQTLPANPDFTLHMGDIQYYASFMETWAIWWPKMHPMLAQGGFFPAVGNHEFEKPKEFELYYERFFDGAGFDGNTRYYRFESGGVWFFSLDSEQDLSPESTQGQWVQAQLADAKSQPGFRYSIVYVHRPWLACGEKGSHPELREGYAPIFQENDVKLVLHGHLHGYERFEMDGLTYVTSGGGGALISGIDKNPTRPECEYRKASGGFYHGMIFEVLEDKLRATTIDDKGAVRDEFEIATP